MWTGLYICLMRILCCLYKAKITESLKRQPGEDWPRNFLGAAVGDARCLNTDAVRPEQLKLSEDL